MLLTILSTIFPLLAYTAVLPSPPRDVYELGREGISGTETRIYGGRVDFGLLPPDVDESLAFIFEVSQPEDSEAAVACGDSVLHLNGRPLTEGWLKQSVGALGEDTQARTDSVEATTVSYVDQSAHSVYLNSSSYCYSWNSSESLEGNQTGRIFELTVVDILQVDGFPTRASFTILFDQTKQQVLGVKQGAHDTIAITEWSDLLIESYVYDQSINEIHDTELDSDTDSVSIAEEIQLLKDLQWDLELLKSTIKDQEFRIHRLSVEEAKKFQQTLSNCGGIRCYIQKLAHKVKTCIRTFILSITTKHGDPESSELHCISQSHFTEAKVLMTGRPVCGDGPNKAALALNETLPSYPKEKVTPFPAKDRKQGEKLDAPEDADAVDPPPQYSEYQRLRPDIDAEARREFESQKKLHTILFAAASLLCCGCVVFAIQRRCMSPRSRAEWRAHCEERRTAREYRQLARRRAMSTWMASLRPRMFRSADELRIQDYEEKRNLIIQQEGILESAMQDEIFRLTSNEASMAEEGFGRPTTSQWRLQRATAASIASTHGGESLPGYRLRSNSGRPPSYTTVDRHPVDDMADGFSDYAPNESLMHSTAASDIVSRSDVTPDSSVREISPRHSSETLRTERSAL